MRAVADRYGVRALPVGILVLAAFGAFDLALWVTSGATVAAFASLVAIGIAMAAIAVAEAGVSAAEEFRGHAHSYRQMLDDYFLVSKVDGQGRFCEANENFLRRTGYTREELVGRRFGVSDSGARDGNELEAMWEIVRCGQMWSGELCERAKNGTLISIRAVVIPWLSSYGVLKSLTIIGVDVSKQRSAETELKRAHARLEAFIKHAPAAVAMFDTDMHYVAHTDRWLADYHLPQTSLVGLHHYDVFPEIPQHWREKHQGILAGGTETCAEERLRRADGSENILRWEVRPWYMPDASIGGLIMLTEEITERKKMQDELWRLAKLDGLTGLPNRLLFNETLRGAIVAAIESGSSLGVALLDLDHFKEINDTLGHDAGDEMLKIVASRLQNTLGGAGTTARLGGDEFAVLILGQDGDKAIQDTLGRIKAELAEPIQLAGTLRACSVSIGVTVYPRDATEPRDLLKNADLALYRAKSFGRGRIDMFSPDLRAAIDRRVELQGSVLDAIQRDEFMLYFQPIIACDRAKPPSFEALLRWQHPTHGLLSPGSFEEVLEDPRLAAAIGDRVLDMALTQAAAWQAEGLAFGRVAINVTSADFAFGSLAERLEEKLKRYGLGAERVCIEVTERVFLDSGTAHMEEALQELDTLGVEIALDDFGTGYASLSHIKAYPISRLKIDRTFVSDMEDNSDNLSIVQAIVQLGRSLGLSTTAEGVENEAQLALLSSMGCGSLQGFYFSRPLPEQEIRHFLTGEPQKEFQVA